MYANAGERARWSVAWVAKGKVQRKDCGSDFAEATRIYSLCVKADKAGATLFSANMSFPPPLKYADTEYVVVTRNGKRYKQSQPVDPPTFRIKMREYNLKGIWWCCFCCKPRKFKKTTRYGDTVMSCPLCGVGHTHGSIMKYNPIAARGAGRKTRSDKGQARG